MRTPRIPLVVVLTIASLAALRASSHRDAPLIAVDPVADITDVYAFRSPEEPANIVLVMATYPFSDPAAGPAFTQFGSDVLYTLRIDNDHDAVEDIVYEFRFSDELRAPLFFYSYSGFPGGLVAPANSPPPVAPGAPLVAPTTQTLNDYGLHHRQRYTVTMIRDGVTTPIVNATGQPFFAVPGNVGSRTMDYDALALDGTYTSTNGIRLFAGQRDDGFFIDLGGVFDVLNTRNSLVMTPAQDAANANAAPDALSGFNVNAIALEIPIAQLTQTGQIEPPGSPAATIGVWATTSRPRITVRRDRQPNVNFEPWVQVSRLGLPLINETVIPLGAKDYFNRTPPRDDSQFLPFVRDPFIARLINAVTDGAVAIPAPPRNDLVTSFFSYSPPVAPPGTPPGPAADLLRLNTGVPPTPAGSTSRLGLLGGDPAGFPNGRRISDDVTDIALRLAAGTTLPLGDGVNVNDIPLPLTFPYLASPHSGRDHRHVDAGEDGDPTPTLVFSGLGADPLAPPPAGAVAWRTRNSEIEVTPSTPLGHIDGPFALPGAPNPLALPVGSPAALTNWVPVDVCLFIHLHGIFSGHFDPAPGPPTTVSACGHGALEWGMFATP